MSNGFENPLQLHEEGDPTRFSTLPPTREMKKVGVVFPLLYDYTIWEAQDGSRYVELPNTGWSAPATQQVVVRLLKGIINVSDIISIPNEEGGVTYYSHIMPLDRIQEETSEAELSADLFLMEFTFSDLDHAQGDESNFEEKDGRIAHFDFGASQWFPIIPEDLDEQALIDSPQETRAILSTKLRQLHEHLSGNDGKQLVRSIVESTGKGVNELFQYWSKSDAQAAFEEFYAALIGRLAYLQDLLRKAEGQEQ